MSDTTFKDALRATVEPAPTDNDTWNSLLESRAKLEREVNELKSWKASMLAVEAEWNEQSLAKMLGVPLGKSCRKVIAERVPGLIQELQDSQAELAKLKLEVNHNWQATDDLEASLAREAQLRAALQALYDLGSLELPHRRDPALRGAFEALTLPAPPVVPVEDVKPLVEALKALQWAAQDDESSGNYAKSALSTFTAKHTIP